MRDPRVLPITFFHRPAPVVARDLLGAVMISYLAGETVAGHIVETEAYLGYDDPASHAWRGRRHRGNEGIYSPPGSWYVYLSYGMHCCANLVCGPTGLGAAVLVRGLVPLEGVEIMRRRRAARKFRHPERLEGGPGRDAALTDGPGKLSQALGITRELDRQPMPASPVVVVEGFGVTDDELRITPRIGITRAADLPLRFLLASRLRHRVA